MSDKKLSRRDLLAGVAGTAIFAPLSAYAKGHNDGVFVVASEIKLEDRSIIIFNKALAAGLEAEREATFKLMAENVPGLKLGDVSLGGDGSVVIQGNRGAAEFLMNAKEEDEKGDDGGKRKLNIICGGHC